MNGGARVEFGKPRQSLTGIVGAGEDRVWNALLETSPYLTPRMREMIAGSRGMLRFPARQVEGDAEASPVPGVDVEADGGRHTLAVSGQWWFCGRYSMSPQGPHRHRLATRLPGPDSRLTRFPPGPPKARVQDRDAGFQALAFARIAGKARFSASFQSPIGAMPVACHASWPRTL